MRRYELSDVQRDAIAPLLPPPAKTGRPRRDPREVLNEEVLNEDAKYLAEIIGRALGVTLTRLAFPSLVDVPAITVSDDTGQSLAEFRLSADATLVLQDRDGTTSRKEVRPSSTWSLPKPRRFARSCPTGGPRRRDRARQRRDP